MVFAVPPAHEMRRMVDKRDLGFDALSVPRAAFAGAAIIEIDPNGHGRLFPLIPPHDFEHDGAEGFGWRLIGVGEPATACPRVVSGDV